MINKDMQRRKEWCALACVYLYSSICVVNFSVSAPLLPTWVCSCVVDIKENRFCITVEPTSSIQVEPSAHGKESHSYISFSHNWPVYPGMQLQW